MSRLSTKERVFFELESIGGRFPRLILPLERRRHVKGTGVAGAGTQIVIEGFPRSGNTFAELAFRLAQPRSVNIAHHMHLSAQVLWAVQHNVPAIALIREPVAAVSSLVIRKYGEDNIGLALRQYQRFYAPLLPVRDQIVVCEFDEMVQNFEPVIKRVNAKWGSSFLPFEHSEENVQRCFAQVEQADLEDHGGNQVEEMLVARPSAARETLAARIRPKVARHRSCKGAKELYVRFVENPIA